MHNIFLATLIALFPQSVLDLAGDATRDGRISFNQEEQDAEETNSIIILNNCDNDNPDEDNTPDNQDDVINGELDRRDLEPILVRRLGEIPTGAIVRLEIAERKDDPIQFNDELELLQRFRIFDKRGNEIIGPESGTSYELTTRDLTWLEHDSMVLYVEGLQFRTSIELSLCLNDQQEDALFLESAPFILMPNSLPTLESFVVESTLSEEVFESRRFLHHFSTISQGSGLLPTEFGNEDLWIQDECSWGYTQTPRQEMPVVLHMLRQNAYGIATTLAPEVQGMIGPNTGYFQAFDYPAVSTTLDIGGNLEVSPPTTKYPFGRIYYGSIKSVDSKYEYHQRQINEGFQKFFKRQGVQDPIDLCTDWLIVGHVDELVTFIPQKNNKMKMLITSPNKALDILNSQSATDPLNSRYRDGYGVSTVGDLLALNYLASVSISDLNQAVDEKLFGFDHDNPTTGSVKKIFKDALGLTEADIIEVPVLYQNYKRVGGKFAVVALTPSLVNLYCLERDLIVPEPFIPSFALDFEKAVKDTNMKTHWIDDWDLYHLGYGEIHCGSNSRRGYFAVKWWEKE